MKNFKQLYKYKIFYNLNLNKIKNLFFIFGFDYTKNYNNNFINNKIIEILNNYILVHNEKKEILKKLKKEKLKKLKYIGLYKGYKYFRGLPTKNQRTKTNAKNSKKFFF